MAWVIIGKENAMDLSTTYMGLELSSPLVPSAGPLSRDIETIKQMEDAGASAVVLWSLFEEQIEHEARELDYYLQYGADRWAESLSYFAQARRRTPGESPRGSHQAHGGQGIRIGFANEGRVEPEALRRAGRRMALFGRSGLQYTQGMIITIDGPAGSGKSTAARELAAKLNIAYLDTGATYRAATLKVLRAGADFEDTSAVVRLARQMKLRMLPGHDGVRVFLDDRDVTAEIRSATVTDNSHYVARCAEARRVLVELQRDLGAKLGDFVAEGRDQGSVVFPEADVKFYLDAEPGARALRRHKEMLARGESASLEEILRAILERDAKDASRDVDPLIKPQGAIEIDTTGMTIEQVTAELLRHVGGAG